MVKCHWSKGANEEAQEGPHRLEDKEQSLSAKIIELVKLRRLSNQLQKQESELNGRKCVALEPNHNLLYRNALPFLIKTFLGVSKTCTDYRRLRQALSLFRDVVSPEGMRQVRDRNHGAY